MATVRRAAVIGTGTMGPGMGAVLARAGIETALYDLSAEALERAKAGAELAGTAASAPSPHPFAPYGPGPSPFSTITQVISPGRSSKLGMR